jgi:hypothetical protein
MMRAIIAVITILATTLFAGSMHAANSIDGAWTLSVEKLPLRMVLELKGRDVSGTLDYPHGAPFQLEGSFDQGTLTFSGDSAGENFTIHIDATAALKSDDALEGRMTAHIVDLNEARQPVRTHDDEWQWTAVRSK